MILRAASATALTLLLIACSSESNSGTAGSAIKAFGDCCTSHSECATGYCSPTERQCTQTCSTDSECPIEEKDGKADCSSSRKECNADRRDVKCASDDGPTPTNETDAGTSTKSDAGKDSGTSTGGTLGLGEPCTDNAQCKSTTCYRPGGVTGFCTKSCTESVQCLGAYGSGKNSLNEYLWCMPFAGGGRCYPGCINTTTACSKFSGLTCRSTKDIKGGAAKVCSEL